MTYSPVCDRFIAIYQLEDMSNEGRKDGKLLEKVVAEMCSGVEKALVTHDAKILGLNTGIERQIDVLIEGKYGFFDVRIVIDSKDYSDPVPIGEVEKFITSLKDVGADLGALVSSGGFTAGAKAAAESANIRLFEIYSDALENVQLFIPVRMIIGNIKRWAVRFSSKAVGPISIPSDLTKVRILVDGESLDLHKMLLKAWNLGKIPQIAGDQVADMGAVKFTSVEDPSKHYYSDLKFEVEVEERFYLRVLPANCLKPPDSPSGRYFLKIPLFTDENLLEEEWKRFETLDEMNDAADIENQPQEIRGLLIRPEYSLHDLEQ